jgi:hypothetical protein
MGEPLTAAESRQIGELDQLHPPDRPGVGALRGEEQSSSDGIRDTGQPFGFLPQAPLRLFIMGAAG